MLFYLEIIFGMKHRIIHLLVILDEPLDVVKINEFGEICYVNLALPQIGKNKQGDSKLLSRAVVAIYSGPSELSNTLHSIVDNPLVVEYRITASPKEDIPKTESIITHKSEQTPTEISSSLQVLWQRSPI